jgi:endonuclease/exonuclease/phosphatase family metal-dependent hydrolase
VIVLGDLNDTPDSAPLAPLLAQTDLRDITTHPSFTSDGRPGTFGNGTKSQKIDYVLL